MATKTRNRTKWQDTIDREAFTKDWEAGMSYADLAKKYKGSVAGVFRARESFNLNPRNVGRPSKTSPQMLSKDKSPAILTDGQWVYDNDGIARWKPNASVS